MKTKTSEKIQKNDEFEVMIDRLGDDAEGIAEHKDMIIFVPRALPGEIADVHVIQTKKNFAVAKIKNFKTKSERRIEPRCKYFDTCGGCDIEHLSYDDGLSFKAEKVQKIFKKFAKIDIDLPKVEKSAKIFRYRNKFSFPTRYQNSENVIGLFHKASHTITQIEDCMLQSENSQKIIKSFKDYINYENLSFFNEQSGQGLIKHLVAREHDNKFLITIVVTDKNFNNFDQFIENLKQEKLNFGLYKNVNNKNNNVILGDKDEHIFGLKSLEYDEFGIKYFVTNQSFVQVNDDVKKLIYEYVLTKLKDTKMVIDAYSGAGLLSAIIARNGHKVYGVEIVREATESANNLKKLNGLESLTNINGDCAVILPKLTREISGEFSIVVDPPRKGLDKHVVESFLSVMPKQIIYISCDPVTLARDAALLAEKFELKSIKCFDMFPQTANVETVVEFKLRDEYGK